MSTVKTRPQDNPFQSQPQSVGKTYGERKAMGVSSQAPSQAAQRSVDNYNREPKRNGDLSVFNPNATYRASRKQNDGAPLRPRILNQIQEGSVTRSTSSTERLSAKDCLAILDKVIDTPAYHNPQNLRKAVMAGKAVSSKTS